MALPKQTIMKEQTIDHSLIKSDENEQLKRRKRSGDKDDNYKKDENQHLLQKKRATSNTIQNRRQNSDDQDDEALIRETQAALKSLSGSWPEPRSPIYKISEADQNPTFRNLFEEKSNNNLNNSKMSPTSTTPTTISNLNSGDQQSMYSYRDQNGAVRSDVKSLQKFRRDKDELNRPKSNFSQNAQYRSYDFNELVDDSSTDIQLNASGAFNENQKDENFNQNNMRGSTPNTDEKFKDYYRNDVAYGNYHSRVPFSQSSAFRPPGDRKVVTNVGVPVLGPYHHTDPNYVGYAPDISAAVCTNEDKDKFQLKLGLEEEATPKSVESPNSKQYTMLQPAGVGSNAASVIQDIVREGVVSVAAVSSTSSPGLSNIPPTVTGDKGHFDRMIPPFSPGSINKGKSFTYSINVQIDIHFACYDLFFFLPNFTENIFPNLPHTHMVPFTVKTNVLCRLFVALSFFVLFTFHFVSFMLFSFFFIMFYHVVPDGLCVKIKSH